ncbi:MAG: c-type cytochrome domain-containing protein [Planctomycetaceae bacterium]
MKYLAVLLLVVSVIPVSRADEEKPIEPAEIKLGRPVDFAKDIAPIFAANCLACHNKGKTEGELNLEGTATILKGSSSGQIVVPGKPDESYLYKVAARQEESFMPPYPNEVQARKLTPEQLGLLRQWIVEGAKAGESATSAANMQWQSINNELTAIYAVDADPFGRFVAAGRAGTVSVYDLLAKDNVASLIDPALVERKSPSQTAHLDYVHSLAFHPGGQMLATSGFQVVKLWERDTANVIQPVALPATTSKMVTSADGTLAAVQQLDGIIRVVDLSTNNIVNELPGHAVDSVTVLGIHGPENQYVSVANADATVKLIARADNSVAAASEALGAKAVDAAFIVSGNKLVVLLEDGTLRPLTLDAAAKTLVAADPLKSEKGAIRQIQLAEPMLMCRIEGNAVELRKTDSLQPAVTIQAGTPNSQAAVSPNAERVATVGPDGITELWNAKDGKLVATLNTDLAAVRTLATRTADKAVRDARVAVVKGQVTEDEKRVTEQQESLKKAEEEIKKTTEAVAEPKKKLEEAVAKTAEAKKALEAKADDAALKKAVEDAEKAEATAKEALTTAENAVASAMKSKTLSEQAIKRAEEKVAERKQLLVAAEAEAKAAADAHTAADAEAKKTVASQLVAFVGNELVATTEANGTTRLYNTINGTAVDLFTAALPEAAKPVALTSAPKALVMQQADGQVARINAFPRWKLAKILGPPSEGQPSVFVDRVLSLAFSPDGILLAAGGGEASRSGELTLWNVADGKLVRTFEDAHSDTVYGLDFSADGKFLASAAADKFVKVFDIATGDHVRSYEGHTHHVMDVSWKGDGTTLASAGADNAIKVWNAETGEQSRTITTYQKQVTSLDFIGMEDDFISCSGDKRVFRHKAANGGTVREFKGCPDYVYCSATTADGALVAAGCEDGILRIWNGADGKEIATFGP